jgi:hypothetical protein
MRRQAPRRSVCVSGQEHLGTESALSPRFRAIRPKCTRRRVLPWELKPRALVSFHHPPPRSAATRWRNFAPPRGERLEMLQSYRYLPLLGGVCPFRRRRAEDALVR